MVAIRFEEFPSFAWSGIAMCNISKRPVNLTVSIEFSVFCIAHLANTKV
jgi:hypothetical protein